MEYDKLLARLKDSATEKHKAFLQKIVNTPTEILGCKSADMRKISRELAKSADLTQITAFPSNTYYEVDMLKGVAIASAKLPFGGKVGHLAEFAQTIDNWAVCDGTSASLKVSAEDVQKLWEFSVKLTQSDRCFVKRLGIVIIMGNFLDETRIDAVLRLIDGIGYGEYYVDMAAAWLISEAFVKFREKTLAYIKAPNNLTKFVRNKALQKVRESYRVSGEDKAMTKNLVI